MDHRQLWVDQSRSQRSFVSPGANGQLQDVETIPKGVVPFGMLFHAVVQDGAITADHHGTADVPWWSFTKTVIAAAALALVRDGRLVLDAPVRGQAYTLRHLLQHRAGLTDYGALRDYHDAVGRNDDAWPPAEMLERARADQLRYTPGEGWAYSNIGYLRVRQLVEETTGATLGAALAQLVLRPLKIEGARLAATRDDLAGVQMGEAQGYDPRWVYHGLMVGPLRDAASLLHRLMTGELLPPELLSSMLIGHPLGGPIADRPWVAPRYGLGLMTGAVTGGAVLAGHTGAGPGSVVAVYHALGSTPARTAAAFTLGSDQGVVEDRCAAFR
jgi:CubicO group peptidase (beta-lactamase class C family)